MFGNTKNGGGDLMNHVTKIVNSWTIRSHHKKFK